MGKRLGFEERADGGVSGGGDDWGERDVVRYFVKNVCVDAEEVDDDGDEDWDTVGGPEVGFVVDPEINRCGCVDRAVDCGAGGVLDGSKDW